MIPALAALAIGLWVGFWAGIAVAIWVSARHDRQSDSTIYDALAVEELRAELESWNQSAGGQS